MAVINFVPDQDSNKMTPSKDPPKDPTMPIGGKKAINGNPAVPKHGHSNQGKEETGLNSGGEKKNLKTNANPPALEGEEKNTLKRSKTLRKYDGGYTEKQAMVDLGMSPPLGKKTKTAASVRRPQTSGDESISPIMATMTSSSPIMATMTCPLNVQDTLAKLLSYSEALAKKVGKL